MKRFKELSKTGGDFCHCSGHFKLERGRESRGKRAKDYRLKAPALGLPSLPIRARYWRHLICLKLPPRCRWHRCKQLKELLLEIVPKIPPPDGRHPPSFIYSPHPRTRELLTLILLSRSPLLLEPLNSLSFKPITLLFPINAGISVYCQGTGREQIWETAVRTKTHRLGLLAAELYR